MPIMHTISTWIRRTFGWMVSPQSWLEIIVASVLVGAAIGLWWFRPVLSTAVLVMLWGVWLVVAAVLFRQGWLKLFGPVLFYDMVRSGRRGWFVLARVLYAGLLFFILWCVFQSHSNRYYNRYGNQGIAPQQAARLAQDYFEYFMAAQLIAVFVLTPAYVAGAIADEKNRRTLEFLLATDLRSREIVLSKLGARLGQMTMFVLAGLPILSFLQFLGGVSPELILAGFVATAMTMFGLAGISIFHSTYYTKPRNAIAISYLTVVVYIAVSFLLLLLSQYLRIAGFSTISPTPIIAFLAGIVDEGIAFLNSGNLLIVLPQIRLAAQTGTLTTQLPVLLGRYALFYGVLGIGGMLWAMLRLRPVAMQQVSKPKRTRARVRLFGRPRIGVLPMLWKELHIEGGLSFNWIGWIIVLLMVAATFLPAVVIFYEFFERGGGWGWSRNPWEALGTMMNGWVRVITVIVGCLMLLAIGVRASTAVTGERDRETLDSLLTTPMTGNHILAAKWLGSIASVRLGWVWLGSVWLLGIVTGGLHFIAMMLLVSALLVYAAFVSILGCWFSTTCKTSGRATIFTLVVTVLAGVGHWVIWLCCGLLSVALRANVGGEGALRLAQFQAGLTPPVALAFLAFHPYEFQSPHVVREILLPMITFSVLGMGFWTFVTIGMWVITSTRFRKLTNREWDQSAAFPHSLQRQAPAWHPPGTVDPAHNYHVQDPRAAPSQPDGAILLDEAWETPRRPPDDEDESIDPRFKH